LGVKAPPSMEIFFNLLEFLEKKIPKLHKLGRSYKRIQNTPSKMFWLRPWARSLEEKSGHEESGLFSYIFNFMKVVLKFFQYKFQSSMEFRLLRPIIVYTFD